MSNSDQVIYDQMAVVNEDATRARLGLSFQLAPVNITRTINAPWANGGVGYGTVAERQMKTTLRRGNVRTLNIYTVK